MTDRAELMREAAAQLAEMRNDAIWDRDTGEQIGLCGIADAIRALPLPPAPPLADDVAKHIARTRKVIAATKAQYIQHGTQPPLTVKAEQSLEWIERLVARVEKVEAEVEKWMRAFAAQSNKLQRVLHIEGVKAALNEGANHE